MSLPIIDSQDQIKTMSPVLSNTLGEESPQKTIPHEKAQSPTYDDNELAIVVYGSNLQSTSSPKPPKMEGGSGKYDELHAQLYKMLKESVSKSKSQLKRMAPSTPSEPVDQTPAKAPQIPAVPLSFQPSVECDPNNIRLDMIEKAMNIKRARTSLAGEVFISFKVPEDFPLNDLEVEKLVPQGRVDEETQNTMHNERRFSFSERLQDWKIERKQRVTGRYDMYFHHRRSNTNLRSTVEVVNFILYEAYPERRVVNKGKAEEDQSMKLAGDETPSQQSTPVRKTEVKLLEYFACGRKEDHACEEKIEVLGDSCMKRRAQEFTEGMTSKAYLDEKAIVEEFLRTSWNNLMNLKVVNEEEYVVSREPKRRRVRKVPRKEGTQASL